MHARTLVAPVTFATLLLGLLTASVSAAAAPVACTMDVAESQYYETGEFVFGEGDPDQFERSTRHNVTTYHDACLWPYPVNCELLFLRDQQDNLFVLVQFPDRYPGRTMESVASYTACRNVV